MAHLAVGCLVTLVADGTGLSTGPFCVLVLHAPVCRMRHPQAAVAVVAGLARVTLRACGGGLLRHVPVLLPPLTAVRERHCAVVARGAEDFGMALIARGGVPRGRPVVLHPAFGVSRRSTPAMAGRAELLLVASLAELPVRPGH